MVQEKFILGLGHFREGRNEIRYQSREPWEVRGSHKVTGFIWGRKKKTSRSRKGIRTLCQRTKDKFCNLPSGWSFACKYFLFCVRLGNWELWPVRVLGVITGDLSCHCNSQLMHRHHQEKQCGFRIHPARLIFIKQQELTQNQLCQTKLISFVDGVTRLVGFSRI